MINHKTKNFFKDNKLNFQSVDRLKDLNKIKKYHNQLINNLTNYLFNFHNSQINKKILKLMIHTWLNYYLQFYFLRWRFFSKISKKKINLNQNINYDQYKEISEVIDTIDFYKLSTNSKNFNYLALKKISIFRRKGEPYLINFKKKKLSSKFLLKKKTNFITKVLFHLSFNIERFFFRQSIFIDKTFPYLLSAMIKVKNFSFPINYNQLFNWKQIKTIEKFEKNLSLRKKVIFRKIKTKENFLRFVQNEIIEDLPIFICEGLSIVKKYSTLIYQPKLIISYSLHVHNELYKFWVLENTLQKKSLHIGVHHGGDHQNLDVLLNFNKLFCNNNYVQWVKSDENNFNLPIPKYVHNLRNKILNFKKKINNPKKLIIVDHTFVKYQTLIRNGPMHNHIFQTEKYLKYFDKKLKKNIKQNLLYLTKNLSIKIKTKIIKKFLIGTKLDLNNYLQDSKLAVCTYPQTAYIDCLINGPTILIINPKFWRHKKAFNHSYKLMKKNNLLFYDIDEAIKFINDNWENLDSWWNDTKTVKAKNKFMSNFNLNKQNSSEKWLNFIDKKLNSEQHI